MRTIWWVHRAAEQPRVAVSITTGSPHPRGVHLADQQWPEAQAHQELPAMRRTVGTPPQTHGCESPSLRRRHRKQWRNGAKILGGVSPRLLAGAPLSPWGSSQSPKRGVFLSLCWVLLVFGSGSAGRACGVVCDVSGVGVVDACIMPVMRTVSSLSTPTTGDRS
jgi:hypothetical protein